MPEEIASEKLRGKVDLVEFIEMKVTTKLFDEKEATAKVFKLTKEHLKGPAVPKPTPEEIESGELLFKVAFVELIEKEATKKEINEKEATVEVCRLIKYHFKGLAVPKPTPEEIESNKLMFKVAFVELIEKEVAKKEFNEKEATV